MKIIVMKFGGTSVANIDHIVKASEKVIEVSKQSKVIVVLSAMAGVTNSLVDQVKKISDNDDPDSDLIFSTGEQVSSGLMSIYLNKKGINSRTWTGWQIPIITNSIFGTIIFIIFKKRNYKYLLLNFFHIFMFSSIHALSW